MQCAIVVYIEDYGVFFDDYGFRRCLDSAADYLDGGTVHVLVAGGFELIPAEVVAAYGARAIRFQDCRAMVDGLMAELPWLEKVAGLNAYLRFCFVRHILLERTFAGEEVLSFDADVVWRHNPFDLARLWAGGSFVLDGSPCLTFARSPDWFAAYRSGLERWCLEDGFGADFVDESMERTGVRHDQDLLQYLAARGLIEQDEASIRAGPGAERFCIFPNPLRAELGLPAGEQRGVRFSRHGRQDMFNGRIVPFWHMQTGFGRYLAYDAISRELFGRRQRTPFYDPANPFNGMTMDALKFIHHAIMRGKLKPPKFERLRQQITRGALYGRFFETDLPSEIFTDEVWWRPGVFAPGEDNRILYTKTQEPAG